MIECEPYPAVQVLVRLPLPEKLTVRATNCAQEKFSPAVPFMSRMRVGKYRAPVISEVELPLIWFDWLLPDAARRSWYIRMLAKFPVVGGLMFTAAPPLILTFPICTPLVPLL